MEGVPLDISPDAYLPFYLGSQSLGFTAKSYTMSPDPSLDYSTRQACLPFDAAGLAPVDFLLRCPHRFCHRPGRSCSSLRSRFRKLTCSAENQLLKYGTHVTLDPSLRGEIVKERHGGAAAEQFAALG